MFVFGEGDVDTMVSQVGQDQVRWTLVSGGKALMSFNATVTPKGDNSANVSLEVEPAPGKANTEVGRRIKSNPSIVNLYKSAMIEQIDSKLENRSFDMSAIQGQMMAATISTMPRGALEWVEST